MNESTPLALLQLRLLVSYLGERAQCGWWSSGFFGATSQNFLRPVFSKTFRLAQYHGVLEAATRVHDEHLSVGAYHLFRLSEELEQDLDALMRGECGERLIDQLPGTKVAALSVLQNVIGASPQPIEGPLQVGRVRDVHTSATLKAIGGAYLAAFRADIQAFPYLVV